MNRCLTSLQLLALCCAALLVVDARTLSSASAPAPSTEEASCVLTTELEIGPYYLDEQLFRSNISEDQVGIPLLLRIKVADTDCEPIVDAFVDVWHCNSTGFYSGFTLAGEDGSTGSAMAVSPTGAPAGQQAPDYNEAGSVAPSGAPSAMSGMAGMSGSAEPSGSPDETSGSTSGSPDQTPSSQAVAAGVSAAAAAAGQESVATDDFTWLRGIQQTDEDGIVEFETIVPGWYSGRTAHIHLMVHVPYNTSFVGEEAEFEDSHVAHTAQIFFDATLYDQIAATYPYTLDLTTRTTNSEDRVYNADPSAVLDITMVGSTLDDGLVATITTHIDPSSTPAAGV